MTLVADNYAEFLGQLKNQIRQRQYQALRAVNHELVDLYRVYADLPNLQPLVAEISWAKNLVILAPRKDEVALHQGS